MCVLEDLCSAFESNAWLGSQSAELTENGSSRAKEDAWKVAGSFQTP